MGFIETRVLKLATLLATWLRRENALISGVILSFFSVAGLHVDTIGDFSSEQLLHDRFSSLFATEDVSRGITSAQSVSSGEERG